MRQSRGRLHRQCTQACLHSRIQCLKEGWLYAILSAQTTRFWQTAAAANCPKRGASMSTEPSLTFGALLRQYRRAAGLTQEELAERAHLSRGAIETLERGS